MNNTSNVVQYRLYPKKYFDASPTWYTWNKLTIADVYALRQEQGFEGQDVFFWLNHPIQYIRLVGVVVAIDLVGYNARYCLITIDDGSGAVIEAKAERTRIPGDPPQYLAETNVDDLEAFTEIGTPVVHFEKTPIVVGDVMRVQGTVKIWRQERQLNIGRMYRVKDTIEETRHWNKVINWKTDVLNRPWVLGYRQQDAIDQKIRHEEKKHRKRAKRKAQADEERKPKEAAREQKRKLKEESLERARKEDEIMMNAGALKGSEKLPRPWED